MYKFSFVPLFLNSRSLASRSSSAIRNWTYAASEGVVRVPASAKWTCGVTIEGVDMDFWRGKREPVSPGIKLLLSANLWLPLFVTIFWYSLCQRKIRYVVAMSSLRAHRIAFRRIFVITCTRSASFSEWVLVCDLHARLPTPTGPVHDFPSNSSSFSLSRLLKLMLRCRWNE